MDFLPKVEDNLVAELPDDIIDDDIIEEKPQITEEDIFNEKPKLVIKEVIEDEPLLPETDDVGGLDAEVVEPVKQPKTQVKTKKKRILSEAHKQKLAEARVKALETRRNNAKIRKEKKELEKVIKDKELEELRAKAGIRKAKKVNVVAEPTVIEPAKKVVEKVETPPKKIYYTQEDLEKASLNAIMGYEKIRKIRKEKKKQEQENTKHERKLKQELTDRIMPQNNTNVLYGASNYWDNCF